MDAFPQERIINWRALWKWCTRPRYSVIYLVIFTVVNQQIGKHFL